MRAYYSCAAWRAWRSHIRAEQICWERCSIDLPQPHVASVRVGVVRDLDRHELGRRGQVHHVFEAWAKDASLRTGDVAQLIHPAIACSVLHRGIAE